MINRDKLLTTEEYWYETLQNDIYRMVAEYLKNKGMNQTQLAEQLGVSKGYISQILNGNFNYTLKKLIELSLAMNIAPVIDFKDLDKFIKEDQQNRFEMQYKLFFNVKPLNDFISILSGNTGNSENVKQSSIYYDLDAA